MSSILEFLKENVTFDRVIMVATLIVSICTLVYTRKRDKRHIKSLLKSKKNRLDEMNKAMRIGMGDIATSDTAKIRAEIEQLEDEL